MPVDKDGKVTGVMAHIRAALMTSPDKNKMTGAGPRRDKKLAEAEKKSVKPNK